VRGRFSFICALFLAVSGYASEPTRVVRLAFVMDSSFTNAHSRPDQMLDEYTAFANQCFQNTGVQFENSMMASMPLDRNVVKLENNLDHLSQIGASQEEDLVVGIISVPLNPQFPGKLGVTRPFQKAIALNIPENAFTGIAFCQELGHVFGAFHSPWKGSIMAEVPAVVSRLESRAYKFDPPALKMIQITKGIQFQKGVQSLTSEQIAAINDLYKQTGEDPSENPLRIAWINVSVEEVKAERLDRALAILQQVLSIFPNDADVYGRMGEVYRNVQEWESAYLAYEMAYKSSNYKTVDYLYLMGRVSYQKGDLASAERIFDEVLQVKSVDSRKLMAKALWGKGNVAATQGRNKAAIKLFDAALAADPQLEEARKDRETQIKLRRLTRTKK